MIYKKTMEEWNKYNKILINIMKDYKNQNNNL